RKLDGCTIFILEAKLDDFELKGAYRTDDLSVSQHIGKELRHAFFHELLQALFELFGLHRIQVEYLLKYFGRKAGYARVGQSLPLCQRIADFQISRVVNTHYITRPGHVDRLAVLCHEGSRVGKSQAAVQPHVEVVAAPLEFSGAYANERDAIPVFRVHVGVYLKDKAGEPFLGRGHHPARAVAARGAGGGAIRKKAPSSRCTAK